MGNLRFTDLQTRPLEVLDLTSLTLEEFRRLVPPFEAAFQAHMAQWRFDGQSRTARRYTTYQSCPLPTPEDRLLFILAYLKTYPLQVVQGRLFGMDQQQGQSMDSPPVRSAESHSTGPGGRPQPVLARVGSAPRGDRGRSRSPGRADGGAIAPGRAARGGPEPSRRFPPFGHDGTERRIARPQDPLEQTRG